MANSVEQLRTSILSKKLRLLNRSTSLMSILGVRVIGAEEHSDVRRAGRFWVYPIVASRTKIDKVAPVLGVRLCPSQPEQQLSIVYAHHSMAVTHCSRPKNAIATLAMHRILASDSIVDWQRLLADLVYSKISGVGYADLVSESMLSQLCALVKEVIDSHNDGDGSKLIAWPKYVEIVHEILDDSSETLRIARESRMAFDELCVSASSISSRFPYDGLLASLLYSCWFRGRAPKMPIGMCSDLILSPACVDGGIRIRKSRFMDFTNWRAEYGMHLAKHLYDGIVDEFAIHGRTEVLRLVTVMKDEGNEYDGSQHLDLARSFLSQSDWLSAWNMLILYSFYHYRSKRLGDAYDRDVPGSIAHIALDAANRAGASHIVALMEKMGVPEW